MKQAPQLFNADELRWWTVDICQQKLSTDGVRERWVSARPLSVGGLWARVVLAWGVFLGRYDAVYWTGGQ